MIALLEFVVWLFVLPYLLFGIFLGHLALAIVRDCESRLLLTGVWFGALGLYLFPRRVPDDFPVVSLVDSIAQSHIAGLSTPLALLAVACLLIIAAALVAAARKRARR